MMPCVGKAVYIASNAYQLPNPVAEPTPARSPLSSVHCVILLKKNDILTHSQVLPLAEETESHDDELFSMDDVKLEVMRSRGAGGQVFSALSCNLFLDITSNSARQQNRVGRSINSHTDGDHSINARWTESASESKTCIPSTNITLNGLENHPRSGGTPKYPKKPGPWGRSQRKNPDIQLRPGMPCVIAGSKRLTTYG